MRVKLKSLERGINFQRKSSIRDSAFGIQGSGAGFETERFGGKERLKERGSELAAGRQRVMPLKLMGLDPGISFQGKSRIWEPAFGVFCRFPPGRADQGTIRQRPASEVIAGHLLAIIFRFAIV